MNKAFEIGNLTKDPEMRATPDGRSVCNFTLAVNRRVKNAEHPEADYFRVTVWDKLAESCGKYLAKGKKAAVIGAVNLMHYSDPNGVIRYYMQLNATDVEFLTPKQGAGTPDEGGYVQVEDEDGNF